MNSIPWILIAVLILVIILAIVAINVTRKKKRKTDYFGLFIAGIVWFIIGIPSNNVTLWLMGLVFVFIGLINKEKWKENRRDWKRLSKEEIRVTIIISIVIAVFLVLGLILLIK